MRKTAAGLARLFSSPWFVAAAVAAALVVRVAWGIAAGDAVRFPDSYSYIELADNLLSGKGLLWGDQYVGRPPLYPALVAATRFTVAGREFLALYAVQALLGAASVGLFAEAARRLVGSAAAGVTAFVLAFDPFLVYYSGVALSETLAIFFLAALFYLFTLALDRPTILVGAWAGLMAGAAFLTRPSAPVIVAMLGAFILIWARPRARAALAVAAMVAVAGLTVLPWGMRNRGITGHWVFTTLGVGATLYDGVGPQADGSSNMEFLHSMPEQKHMSEYDRDRYLRDKALAAAKASPARVARLAAVKAGRFWSPVPTSEGFSGWGYKLVSLAYIAPVYLFALGALFLGALSRRNAVILLSAPAYFTLAHMAFVGSTRYRAPVMPFIVIIAAAGAAALIMRAEGRDA